MTLIRVKGHGWFLLMLPQSSFHRDFHCCVSIIGVKHEGAESSLFPCDTTRAGKGRQCPRRGRLAHRGTLCLLVYGVGGNDTGGGSLGNIGASNVNELVFNGCGTGG